jgi:ubiquinone/menaquinone biosynthesis C-methylase UbiE
VKGISGLVDTTPAAVSPQLLETQQAFDSVAADYDGPRGNNDLIQDIRREMWRCLDATFSPGSSLIDLGCGTGLDAVRMAQLGHHVTATDWSPRMVERTRDRAEREGLTGRVRSVVVGAHELQQLSDVGGYDGAYSNLGPLNCVPKLTDVSNECARLIKPEGRLVFTVIGRFCPWEIAHYLAHGRWGRATVRFARGIVPVSMNQHTIWTRYYWPGEFYRAFRREFVLEHYRGLCVFAPPPYLTWVREKHATWHERLWRLDRRVASLPMIRGLGDHFMMVMRRR